MARTYRHTGTLEIRHDQDCWLIEEITDAIDAASSKYIRTTDCRWIYQRNQNFRGKQTNIFPNQDRRRPLGPEIKSSGYVYQDRYTVQVFSKSLPGRLYLSYASVEDDFVLLGKVFTTKPLQQFSPQWRKDSAVIIAWLLERVLYHFSSRIDSAVARLGVYDEAFTED